VPDLPGDAATKFQADLRYLSGLARASLAGDDHHLMIPDRRGDLVLALADRKLSRICDDRHRSPPGLDPGLGCGDIGH
jgi:hypothetical protein